MVDSPESAEAEGSWSMGRRIRTRPPSWSTLYRRGSRGYPLHTRRRRCKRPERTWTRADTPDCAARLHRRTEWWRLDSGSRTCSPRWCCGTFPDEKQEPFRSHKKTGLKERDSLVLPWLDSRAKCRRRIRQCRRRHSSHGCSETLVDTFETKWCQ